MYFGSVGFFPRHFRFQTHFFPCLGKLKETSYQSDKTFPWWTLAFSCGNEEVAIYFVFIKSKDVYVLNE